MSALKTAVYSGLLVLVSVIGAHAATLQTYTIRAEGGFAALEYGALYSYDRAASAFHSYQNVAFEDAGHASLEGHPLSDVFHATSGSAQLRYNAAGDPLWGNASITGCSGLLMFLCKGGTQVFDAAAQSLRSFDINSSLTILSPTELIHQNDTLVDWTAGSTSFFNSGGVETVSFKIASLSIALAPVPLPAGLALLLVSLGVLAGVKLRAGRG